MLLCSLRTRLRSCQHTLVTGSSLLKLEVFVTLCFTEWCLVWSVWRKLCVLCIPPRLWGGRDICSHKWQKNGHLVFMLDKFVAIITSEIGYVWNWSKRPHMMHTGTHTHHAFYQVASIIRVMVHRWSYSRNAWNSICAPHYLIHLITHACLQARRVWGRRRGQAWEYVCW